MKLVLVATLGVLLLAGQTSAESYGYSISASNTDPWVNQAVPQAGVVELYVWLTCIPLDLGAYAGEFNLEGSFLDRWVGFEDVAPVHTILYADVNLAWFVEGSGCVFGSIPIMKLFFFDPLGIGGGVCLADPPPGPGHLPFLAVADCDTIGSTNWPASVVGFASDGTAPCEIGFCDFPVGLDGESWGKVKSLYR